MTFYNVLSALLFLGSLRVFLVAIDILDWRGILTAGCLVIVVFNDMLSTSNIVECNEATKYTLPLMIIDLINFMLLALAVVVLSPTKNLFDVPLINIASYLGTSSFWFLLMLYWLLLMLWTRIAYPSEPHLVKRVLWQSSVAFVFLAEGMLQVCKYSGAATIFAGVVFLYLILYLTWLRSWIGSKPATAP